METPVPIPNTEVKHSSGGNSRARPCEESTLPVPFLRDRPQGSGGDGGVETPVPIPNTEVKHSSGGNSRARPCEESTLPVPLDTSRYPFFYAAMAEWRHLYPSRTQKLSTPAAEIAGRAPVKRARCRFLWIPLGILFFISSDRIFL